MRKAFALTAALALLGLGVATQAAISIETVPVGDPGNAGDTASHSGNPDGQGSVAYTYNIGKYEVTAGQYTAFLNAVAATDTCGLYSTYMDTAVNSRGCNIKRSGISGSYTYSVADDWANRPVNWVGYWDSCRFANWLHNGQPMGFQDASTTECGAYTLDGYTGNDGRTIQRNANWTWAVTSEDEWYKAAYYKGGGTNAGYWDYPTKSNTRPSSVGSDGYTDPGNHANYHYTIDWPYLRTNVGEFENSASAYGTFDQGGNVWEWNEAVPYVRGTYEASRGQRGGSFSFDPDGHWLTSWNRYYYYDPGTDDSTYGFRVSHIPEPPSIIALLGGLTGLIGLRRRRA